METARNTVFSPNGNLQAQGSKANFPAVKKDAKENDRKEIVNVKERQATDASDAK